MDGDKNYRWTGVNRLGQTIHGQLSARNLTLAKIKLHQEGIHPHKVKPNRAFLNYLKSYTIQPKHITTLTQQLERLLKANMPLSQSLALLKAGESHPKLKRLINMLQTDIQSGLAFADALEKHPKYFNALFCHIIRAGERSGAFAPLLAQLLAHQIKRDALKQKIKKSLAYPITILGIACMVTFGLLIFVVPEFAALFESFHATLPVPTQLLIDSALMLKQYGLYGLFTLTGLGYAFRYGYQQSHAIRLKIDTLILALPYLGPLLKNTILTRFTQTLSILLSSGLPLVDALGLTTQVAHNARFESALLNTQVAITEGLPLRHTLENTGLFPTLITQMIGIGEASGQLNEILSHLANQQDEALNHTLDTLSSLFEPILMAVLGLWIGGLIIALYLPIFQIGGIVS